LRQIRDRYRLNLRSPVGVETSSVKVDQHTILLVGWDGQASRFAPAHRRFCPPRCSRVGSHLFAAVHHQAEACARRFRRSSGSSVSGTQAATAFCASSVSGRNHARDVSGALRVDSWSRIGEASICRRRPARPPPLRNHTLRRNTERGLSDEPSFVHRFSWQRSSV
jgi:hypothetical protein